MKDDPTKVKLPRKSDGSEYNILETNPEQQKIAALVIDTIIKWIQKSPDFKPIRLTVCAGAGIIVALLPNQGHDLMVYISFSSYHSYCRQHDSIRRCVQESWR